MAAAPFILVVDDERDGREMLTEYLRFRGFAVVAAAGGRAAVFYASTDPPAIILMDLQMPGVDGYAAARTLKEQPHTRDIVIIALSAHAMTGDEQKALDAGCDAYVSKPYDIIALADALERVIQHGRTALRSISGLTTSAQR
jgi:two-component system, cell cycle response regulator DivK